MTNTETQEQYHRSPRIFIAGAISSIPEVGAHELQQFLNVRVACEVATEIAGLGAVPYVPHLFAFWHLITPKERPFWIEQGASWMEACDAVYVLGSSNWSSGAQAELSMAAKIGKPMFADMRSLRRWMHDRFKVEAPFGMLCDYETGEEIRPASEEELGESVRQARIDGGAGAIDVAGRTCYVEE